MHGRPPAPRFSPLARHPHRPPAAHELTAVIEIPTNERNTYELDKQLGIYRLDRVLHSAVHYPGNYGFLPRTLGEDGDRGRRVGTYQGKFGGS